MTHSEIYDHPVKVLYCGEPGLLIVDRYGSETRFFILTNCDRFCGAPPDDTTWHSKYPGYRCSWILTRTYRPSSEFEPGDEITFLKDSEDLQFKKQIKFIL